MDAPRAGRRFWLGCQQRHIGSTVLAGVTLLAAACSAPAPSDSAAGHDPAAPPPAARAASPVLTRDVPLRAAPDAAARAVAGTLAGTPVRLVGRLEDDSWFFVEVVGRLDALGWVPASALDGIEAARAAAPVVAQPGSTVPAAGPPDPRDLPNLLLDAVSVRQNQLVVALANDGYTDLAGPFTVTVNNGPPHFIALPGKPLRPGDRIENVLNGEFVQRRASVTVVAAVAVPEQSSDDNRLALTVEPDQPLDLEVLTVVASPRFAVTLRNNSPIPLVGEVTITVRESRPSDRLLTRLDDAPLNIAKGGTQEYLVPAVVNADLTRIQVLLQTSAINDADLRNDVYPR